MVRPFFLLTAFITTLVIAGSIALSHHNVYLPLVPDTPAIRDMLRDGHVNWCVNTRGENYPNFVNQLNQEYDYYGEQFGLTHSQVAHGSSDCEHQHDMLVGLSCSPGCAAHVFFWNWPVIVEYDYNTGYWSWFSTQGHEIGHIFGLHEQYVDLGSIGCDRGYDAMVTRLGFETVMSCGTGVGFPTQVDVDRICVLVDDGFKGCQPEVKWPQYDGFRWQFENATAYVPSTGYWQRLIDGEWVNEWSQCKMHQGQPYRTNFLATTFTRNGSEVWNGSVWSKMPYCTSE